MVRIGKKHEVTRFRQLAELVEPPLDSEQNLLEMPPLKVAKHSDLIFAIRRRQHGVGLNDPSTRDSRSKYVEPVRLQVFPMHDSL